MSWFTKDDKDVNREEKELTLGYVRIFIVVIFLFICFYIMVFFIVYIGRV